MKRRPARRTRAPDGQLTATVTVAVPFQDADPSGAAWHGNYFRYFDAARCALLDRLEYGYRAMADSGYIWPIVDTRVRYLSRVGFDDVLEVTAALDELEFRMRIGYRVRDAATGRRVAEAYTVQVPVDAASGEMCLGIPERLRERLRNRVRALLDD